MRGCLKRTQGMTHKDLLELKKIGFTFWKRGNSQHENIPINKSCIETLVQSFWDLSSKGISIYVVFWRGDVSKGQKGWLIWTHFYQKTICIYILREEIHSTKTYPQVNLWDLPTELLRSLQQNNFERKISRSIVSIRFGAIFESSRT